MPDLVSHCWLPYIIGSVYLSVCLCVVFLRDRLNMQMLRASLSESLIKFPTIMFLFSWQMC